MPTINLEISNLKTTIQIEASLDTSFQELGNLLLKHFQLDPKDYNEQNYSIKFIYNKIICIKNKCLSFYDIKEQSKLNVFISKDLLPIIKSKALTIQATQSNSNIKGEQKSEQKKDKKDERKIEQNEVKKVENRAELEKIEESKEKDQIKNQSKPQPTISSQQEIIQIPSFQLQPPPVFNLDSKLNKFLQRIDNNDLNILVKMGYPQKDAAYALFMKQNIEDAQKFLNAGLLRNKHIYNIIEEMVDIPIGCDYYLKKLIEYAVFESSVINEMDQTLAVALTIVNYTSKYGIQNPQYKADIDSFVNTAREKFPEEFARRVSMMNLQQNIMQGQPIYNQQMHQQQMMEHQMLQQQMMQQQMLQQQMMQQQMFQQQTQNPYQQQFYQNQNYFIPPSAGNVPIVVVDPVLNIKDKFHSIFQNIPNMTPDSFINPFNATYDEIMSFQPGPITVKVFNYGRTLNFEQIKFVYRMSKTRGITMEKSVQFLEIAEGDINNAEELING